MTRRRGCRAAVQGSPRGLAALLLGFTLFVAACGQGAPRAAEGPEVLEPGHPRHARATTLEDDQTHPPRRGNRRGWWRRALNGTRGHTTTTRETDEASPPLPVPSEPQDSGTTTTTTSSGSGEASPPLPVPSEPQDSGTTTTTTSGDAGTTTSTIGGDVVTPSTAHRVLTNADSDTLAGGFTVPAGQTWEFAADQSVRLEVRGNVVVNGVLRMRPSSPTVEHELRFVEIDENAFVGGGMSVLSSDVGLWVMGEGQLDLNGAQKLAWTNLRGEAMAGSSTITIKDAPSGWRVGDRIAIAPTAPPTADEHYAQFDERTVTGISGNTISLDRGLTYDHPMVDGTWTAEVMNLTRNIQIGGTGENSVSPSRNGRAHVLIHSSKPQAVRNIQLQHMGPRTSGDNTTVGVTGRYALHFHHCGDGSRGSIVDGVVAWNTGSHAFVPHASNGITIRNSIAYDGWEEPFWWDPPPRGWQSPDRYLHDSHGIMLDHNIAAGVHSEPWNRGQSGYRLGGFRFATGTDLTLRNSVAVGVEGSAQSAGLSWTERVNDNSAWTFENNVTHNNKGEGAFIWQNHAGHTIKNLDSYHNGSSGIEHGAYLNFYVYDNVRLYGNGSDSVRVKNGASGRAGSDGYSFAIRNIRADDALIIAAQTLEPHRPNLYYNCRFTEVIFRTSSAPHGGRHDFVDCDLSPSDFDVRDISSGTVIRVQNGSDAYSIDSAGRVTQIAPFYGG